MDGSIYSRPDKMLPVDSENSNSIKIRKYYWESKNIFSGTNLDLRLYCLQRDDENIVAKIDINFLFDKIHFTQERDEKWQIVIARKQRHHRSLNPLI